MPAYTFLIRRNGMNYFVLVRGLKFDYIRQETYYATIKKLCKQLKTEKAAIAYIDKMKKLLGDE
jgi:hypothetical protein